MRYALPAPAASYAVEAAPVDRTLELRTDQSRSRALPQRYAAERLIDNIRALPKMRALGGEWRNLPDGMAVWRIPLHVANARSLDFVFRRFFLPPGAQLFIRGDTETLGAYTDADNTLSRTFATPLVHGEHAQIELLLPQKMKPFLELELGAAYAGYRDILAPKSIANPGSGSGSCNIDTICSEGDNWRHEINAVAVLASTGAYCSGQLVNNTSGDSDPLLLTAHHCFSSASAGNNLVVYWKYESPVCRVVGSSDNALPVSSASAVAQTGGATLLATHASSDTTLFRLHAAPPTAVNVYYNGWDRTEATFTGGVAIHHPEADAKRITLAADPIVVDDTDYGDDVAPGINHWYVDSYAEGTTEPGSSGSGLLDLQHHVRGVLSGGSADCSEPDGYDLYGRLSVAWNGDGTPQSRLADWLDPKSTSATQLDGAAACSAPTVSLTLSESLATVGDRISASVSASGGHAPYTYAFDVDGDGVSDSTDPSQASIPIVYPGAYAGNVSVKVTDSSDCSATASAAVIVQAPDIEFAAAPVPAPINLCGSSDGTLNPGQRWRNQVVLINTGNTSSQAGYAVFAQDPQTLAQTSLTLETPSVALPALAPGESTSFALDYAIDPTTACASPVRIDLLGTGDTKGFHAAPTEVISRTVTTDCLPVTTCPAQPPIRRLDSGAYYDPVRPGTGMTLITLPQGDNDPVFFGVWFSADSAREPTWYQLQAALHGAQVNSPLFRTQQTQPPTWPQRPAAIGAAQVTLLADDKLALTWSFAGGTGGAIYVPVTAITSNIRIWYNPSESGWGIYDQLAQISGADAPPLIASVLYLYDGAGTPRWVQGNDPAYVPGATLDVAIERPTCPGCVWLDYKAGEQNIGTMSYTGSTNTTQLSTNISFPAPLQGGWVRNQLPLNLIYQSQ